MLSSWAANYLFGRMQPFYLARNGRSFAAILIAPRNIVEPHESWRTEI
jgi:hypothetical protein